jgi:glucose-1-phosphate thymidylyltransferase
VLRGPVVIGPGTSVSSSTIGPNVSVEEDCVIADSTLEDSIVMERCRIEGVGGLTGSILGRDVVVRHSGARGARRLTVGDQSRVDLD